MCGRKIKRKQLRYELKIEIKAAYDQLEINLLDFMHDNRKEYEKLIRKMKEEKIDPQKLQDDVYKQFQFHLCRNCQQRYIQSPLSVVSLDIKNRLRDHLE